MDYGTFVKVYDCMLSLMGEWKTENGNYTVDATDIIIIAKILQFTERNNKCYMSDAAFANMVCIKNKTAIQKRMKKLEDIGIIKRLTSSENINGKTVSHRELSVLELTRDRLHIKPAKADQRIPVPKEKN